MCLAIFTITNGRRGRVEPALAAVAARSVLRAFNSKTTTTILILAGFRAAWLSGQHLYLRLIFTQSALFSSKSVSLQDQMRVLCVAEKPSIARSVTGILSGGQYETVRRHHFYPRT